MLTDNILVVFLSGIALGVIILSVIMLSVSMLRFISVSVVAPFSCDQIL